MSSGTTGMTFNQFEMLAESRRLEVPVATAWLLAELGESRGRQELFVRQAPQRLKALREFAVIESAIASNRIEGVEIAPERRDAVLSGRGRLTDRDETEVRGYRDALRLIHQAPSELPVSEDTIRRLHRLVRAGSGDAGAYKQQDSDIIERHPDGRSRVRFRTVPAANTSSAMRSLVGAAERCRDGRWVPPLVTAAAFNLDFLCVHPFRDGNGRVSRLLLLLQAYQAGYEVGRYISLERVIEENKERYYETLEQSSASWHDGRHDPWPYVNFLLFVIRTACAEFERRVGETGEPRGSKTAAVINAIARLPGEFKAADVLRACPAVSLDMVRRVLKDEQRRGRVECLGRGPGARWRKAGRA